MNFKFGLLLLLLLLFGFNVCEHAVGGREGWRERERENLRQTPRSAQNPMQGQSHFPEIMI